MLERHRVQLSCPAIRIVKLCTVKPSLIVVEEECKMFLFISYMFVSAFSFREIGKRQDDMSKRMRMETSRGYFREDMGFVLPLEKVTAWMGTQHCKEG